MFAGRSLFGNRHGHFVTISSVHLNLMIADEDFVWFVVVSKNMGNAQTAGANRLSTSSEPGATRKKPPLREHKRHGFVTVKVHSNNPNRRPNEGVVSHIISPKGSILYGSLHSPTQIVKGTVYYFIFTIFCPYLSL